MVKKRDESAENRMKFELEPYHRNVSNKELLDDLKRLPVDHIKPWTKGRETVMGNLQTLCNRCNIGKSDI
jgi:5-methylcytosine-specific restriction endonuclease McrA